MRGGGANYHIITIFGHILKNCHFWAFDERPPVKKKSRGSTEFTTTFSKSYKDFKDLEQRQKKNKTQPLLDMLEKFIDINQFSLTLTELLDYLKSQVQDKNKDVPVISFSPMEAVSFMHCMVLSKE